MASIFHGSQKCKKEPVRYKFPSDRKKGEEEDEQKKVNFLLTAENFPPIPLFVLIPAQHIYTTLKEGMETRLKYQATPQRLAWPHI